MGREWGEGANVQHMINFDKTHTCINPSRLPTTTILFWRSTIIARQGYVLSLSAWVMIRQNQIRSKKGEDLNCETPGSLYSLQVSWYCKPRPAWTAKGSPPPPDWPSPDKGEKVTKSSWKWEFHLCAELVRVLMIFTVKVHLSIALLTQSPHKSKLHTRRNRNSLLATSRAW